MRAFYNGKINLIYLNKGIEIFLNIVYTVIR
nr:MAG TPA: tRNA modification GTPase mnmE [Caudoviricetes sp.]